MTLRDEVQLALGDGYLIERELGRGGMGTVFLARDVALERLVAVKALPPEMAVQPQMRERFLRETRIVAGFSHPNIVPVHAVVERGTSILFVMGYVDGETLTDRVRRGGPLGAADLVRLLQEMAWALAYAHGKPDNVIMERATGRSLLTDFGIARTASAGTALTSFGEVVGTPHFMSPEQAAGEPLDGRSDLYSLGVTAFFAATGRLPFDAPSVQAILAMHLTQAPPLVTELRPDLPQALASAIDRCLAKEPGDRFVSGETLVDALEPVRASAPSVAPAVRQFLSQGEQTLRMLLVVGLMIPLLIARLAEYSDGDLAAFLILGLTLILLLLRGLLVRAQALVRQGHRYQDILAGAAATAADRAAAVAALHADPVEQRRRRRERNARALALVMGVAFIWITLTRLRSARPGGGYTVGAPGMLLAIAGLSLLGFFVISALTEPGRSSPLQHLAPWLWRGPFGRLVFHAASRGQSAEAVRATSLTGAVAASPMSVLETLPKARQRELRAVRPGLKRLEAMLDTVRAQQRELDFALAESRQTDPVLSNSEPGVRRRAIVEELTASRRTSGERHLALVEAREAVRLQLLRFRTGLGSAADVQRELDGALGIGDRNPERDG